MSPDRVVRDVMRAAQPNRRFVGTREPGALAVFRCAPAAASICGVALPVDRGWTPRQGPHVASNGSGVC